MKKPAILLTLSACALIAGVLMTRRDAPITLSTQAEPTMQASPAPVAAVDPYQYGPASIDGIGKFYLGREISQVMGHPALGWLEREEREHEEAPSRALDAIKLSPTDVIADVGAGSGYYAFRLAPKVPQGRVIAIDIQQEMLDYLRAKAEEQGIHNVVAHLGRIDDVQLPEASLDAALLVDAYHEFSHPAEMLASLNRALKPQGQLILLEFRGEDPRVPIKPLHKMTEAQARKELAAAGFSLVSNRRVLPWQHFMIFQKSLSTP
jgi:ubiquinone/menaquinone biosynthesis C-methylase UbiE